MSFLLSKMSIILVTLYLCINVIVFWAAALYGMTYRTITQSFLDFRFHCLPSPLRPLSGL